MAGERHGLCELAFSGTGTGQEALNPASFVIMVMMNSLCTLDKLRLF
jgi:hypothetical protein